MNNPSKSSEGTELRTEAAVGSALERCETCAHWKFEGPDWEYDELRMGECKAIKQRETIDSEATEGLEDRWGDEADARKKAALLAVRAIAVDGSGYYAAVRTAPDFGCVLHSPQTASDKSLGITKS